MTGPPPRPGTRACAPPTTFIARADADHRAVALVPLGDGPRDISFTTAGSARVRLHQIKPTPHTIARAEALPAITRFLAATGDVELIWLSDGARSRRRRRFRGEPGAGARAPPDHDRRRRHRRAARAHRGRQRGRRARRQGAARLDRRRGGRNRARARPQGPAARRSQFHLQIRATRETTAEFDLPVEIRNDIARIDIVGERSAGAVQLLDKRWRRRTVGIVSGATADTSQPLLSSSYYIERALGPFADVRLGAKRIARRSGDAFHRSEPADAGARRCRQRRRRRP